MPNITKIVPRVLDEMGFFSKALEEAQRLPMSRGSDEQFKAMLLKQGVKPDELKYTGAGDWLSSKDTVEADALVDYLRKNQVKLNEREYSDRAAIRFEDSKEFQDAIQEQKNYYVDKALERREGNGSYFAIVERNPNVFDDADEFPFGVHNEYDELQKFKTETEAEDFRDKLEQSEMEEWYKEIENNLPEEDIRSQAYSDLGLDEEHFGPKFGTGWQTKGGKNYREILMKNDNAPKTESMFGGNSGANPRPFETSHFPDDPNIVAHLRVKNYDTPEGHKVTLADETQSDWAQQGRDEGFSGDTTEIEQLLGANTERLNLANDALYDGMRKRQDVPEIFSDADLDLLKQEKRAVELERMELQNKLARTRNAIPAGPFVDNTSKWTELMIKRGLTEAARDKSDFFAWPHGADVADRYNMRKVIDKLSYKKNPEASGWIVYDDRGDPFSAVGTKRRGEEIAAGREGYRVEPDPDFSWDLDIFQKGGRGGRETPMTTRVRDSQLDATVGRDLADKMRSGHGENSTSSILGVGEDDVVEGTRTLSGDGIPVGGEGHIAYYDQIMPKRVEEVMRKHVAQAKTEPVDLSVGTRRINVDRSVPETVRVQGVRLSPEMREKILKSGFPLFAIAGMLGMSEDELRAAMNEPQGFAGGGRVGLVQRVGKGLIEAAENWISPKGKPRTVKIPDRGEFAAAPIKELDEAAEAYMKKHGVEGTHRIDEYPDFDEDFAKYVAKIYDEAKHAPTDPKLLKSYDAMIDETLEQLRAAESAGIDFRFLREGMSDPYSLSPSGGYADIVDNARLYTYPTEFGFGSDAVFDPSANPLLKRVGRVGDKKNATANDAFRVVHDLYGHYGPGNPFFRHQGEDRAWQHHARMFSDEALPAMSAETRGQNSWVNFGPHGNKNRSSSAKDTVYADQKSVLMPKEVTERNLGRKLKYADGGPVYSDNQRQDIMKLFDPDADIRAYETIRDYVAKEPANIRSQTHIGPKPRRGVTLNTFGTDFSLGDAPYDVAEGAGTLAEMAYTGARLAPYINPWTAPVAAATDLAEAYATGDPLEAVGAVAFGPGGKLVKAVGTGITAATMGADPAEAKFFGPLARGANKEMLKLAQKFEQSGAGPEAIRQETGWFRGLDGKWRYEVANPDIVNQQYLSKYPIFLHEIHGDPQLFENYPAMRDVRFNRANEEGAYYDRSNNKISVGDTSGRYLAEQGGYGGAIEHEIDHAIANLEGYAPGSNLDDSAYRLSTDMERLNRSRDPYDRTIARQLMTDFPQLKRSMAGEVYMRDPGEMMARNASKRRNYTEEDIRNTSPMSTLDRPAGHVINAMDNRAEAYDDLLQYVLRLQKGKK